MKTGPDDNKALTHKLIKAMNDRDLDAVGGLIHPEYKFNEQQSSAEGNKRYVDRLHTAYPGLRFESEDMLAEDDKVAFRWRMIVKHPQHGEGHFRGTNLMKFRDAQMIDNIEDDCSGKHRFFPAGGGDPIET